MPNFELCCPSPTRRAVSHRLLEPSAARCALRCLSRRAAVDDTPQFVSRIDVDTENSLLYRLVDFVRFFGNPIVNNLLRRETSAQRLIQFAAAVHLDVDTALMNALQQRQVAVRFAGIKDLRFQSRC